MLMLVVRTLEGGPVEPTAVGVSPSVALISLQGAFSADPSTAASVFLVLRSVIASIPSLSSSESDTYPFVFHDAIGRLAHDLS